RPDELWDEHYGGISCGWTLCRPGSQWREAGRSAGGASNQVRAGHKSQSCSDARLDYSTGHARARRRGHRVNRRAAISLLGGAAAWPLAARGQPPRQMRRIGVLSSLAADDAETQARHAAFLQGLQEKGWTSGRNVQIDYRWGAGDADRFHKYAAELVALTPDVILATGSPVTAALLQVTRTLPIVFAQVPDPVANGFVASLAQPGGNVTGFTIYEYGTSAKWIELLKEIAPHVTRAAVLRDPAIASGIGQLAA